MDLNRDKDSLAIVDAIIGLAKSLHLKVTAEGIEEKNHVQYLRENNCDEGQGFFYGKPMPNSEFEQLLLDQAV